MDHDLSGSQLPRLGSGDNLEETEKISTTSFFFFFFFFFFGYTASINIGTSCSSVFTCQALDSPSYPISSSLPPCSFLSLFFFFFNLLFFFSIPFHLYSILSLPFLIISYASLYIHPLLLFLTLFNLNTFVFSLTRSQSQ